MDPNGLDVVSDIKEAFVFFLDGLNWAFIIMFSFVIYGIRNEAEFEWYNNLMKKSKLKIWLAGFVIAFFTCLFKWLDNHSSLTPDYVSALLRSFMVTVILNKAISSMIKSHIEQKIKETK